MPLGDIAALDEWGERENPPYLTWRAVRDWIAGLADAPWQAPSVPFPELLSPATLDEHEGDTIDEHQFVNVLSLS